ncbi:MAG: sigma-70 family RNA polymerase sigma factor [Kofleriaceae bacterium]
MIDVAALEADLKQACEREEWELAATVAIRGYGPELLGYLNAMLRDAAEADDVFSTVCELIWNGVQRFSWQASFRTWAYAITRNACISFIRGSRKRRSEPLSTTAVGAIAEDVRTKTASYLGSQVKDRLAEIRSSLDPDDQTLLILRVDRQLPWREIAQVFEPETATPAELDRRATALRKRFERLKEDLRVQLVK